MEANDKREGNERIIELTKTYVQTEEQLLEACRIDTNVWEIVSMQVKSYQAGANDSAGEYNVHQLFSVSARFKRKNDNFVKFWEKLQNCLYEYAAPKPLPVYPKSDKKALIVNLYDAHIDKVTRVKETRKRSNLIENCKVFNEAVDRLVEKALRYCTPELIIFPVGNDFINVNSHLSTTTKGTPQDSIYHIEDVFDVGLNLVRGVIDRLRTIAPVKIPIVRGNHDTNMTGFLGVALDALYRDDKAVTIDNSREQRKYIQYGKNMFLFAHGDKEKRRIKTDGIPLIMANEEPLLWAKTDYRFAYFGDIHHRDETHFKTGKDYIGVYIRFLRAMSSQDAWHHAQGYIGVPKAAEAVLHSLEGDEVDNFAISFK
jgi:hypothetical protein